MKKTINKLLTAIIGLAMSLCVAFGVLCMESKMQTPALAETVTSSTWGDYWGQGLTATDDTETNYTYFTHNAYGQRMYYKEKVALDGLTVTIGSTDMVAQSLFGFGLAADAGNYTPESGPFNVTVVPSLYSGQDCVFFNTTHDYNTNGGTVVYVINSAGELEKGVCFVDALENRFISAPSSETRYSISFAYGGELSAGVGYWSATITLDKGATFRSHLTSATVYFYDSQLNGILDSDGKCYISTWAMSNAGEYYIGVKTAEEKAALSAADTALAAYETARKAGGTIASERAAAVEAVANVPAKYQTSYQAKLDAIDAIDSDWAVASGNCSASYDTETGYTVLNPNEYGERLYRKEKVKLDGLTVTIGAKNTDMAAQSRFGFGFVSTDTSYSPEFKGFNLLLVPEYRYNKNCVFFNNTHDDNDADGATVVYTADTFEAGVYNVPGLGVEPCFYSEPADTGNTVYSITFKYMGLFEPVPSYGNYWLATIEVIEGSTYLANFGLSLPSSVTVAFLESSLNGALDGNGECYISTFGMSGIGEFYMGVEEAEDSVALSAAESAMKAYEEAVRSGEDTEAKKAEALSAIENLNANEYIAYVNKVETLGVLEDSTSSLSQSVSLTVTDGLELNYKIAVPEAFGEAETVALTMVYRDEEFSYGDIQLDDIGRYVFKMNEITPQYMSEPISFTFEANDASGDLVVRRKTESYSVKAYCESLLAASEDAYLRKAIVDMLNYGAAAQAYVNNANTPANAGIDSYQKYATSVDPATATNVLAANQSDVVTFTSATLVLEDKISVGVRFKTKEAYGVARITATAQIGGNAAKSVEVFDGGDGTYYVLCDEIIPTQYDENIIFRVSVDGTEYGSCRYSVNSYVARNYNNAKSGALVKALYAYGVGMDAYVKMTENVNTSESGNLLGDTLFGNGVKVFGTTSANQATDYTVYNTLIEGATPNWQVAQWDSRYDFQDVSNPSFSNGVYTFTDNNAKTLKLNANTGGIYMEILGEKEYPTQDRQNSTDLWPHLLMQQEWFGSELVQLSSLSSMKMKMTYTVNRFENKMHGSVNEGLHRAQFVWYITLQNRTEDSADYGEYMWFGLTLFDNADVGESTTTFYRGDDDTEHNTGMLICLAGAQSWSPTRKIPGVGETVSVNYDILTEAKAAFDYAKGKGWFSSSSWSDIYIGSTNFGFEIPGTYNIGVQIDEVGLYYAK
ncbi:MAG: hypothetical protein E7380_05350 [Clostridiales bacterium]|nr:hypothetical protein [Clostridiales bacterium]